MNISQGGGGGVFPVEGGRGGQGVSASLPRSLPLEGGGFGLTGDPRETIEFSRNMSAKG